MGTKKAKGTVSIEKVGNRIRLRWRCYQKRYSLSLFKFTKYNLLEAQKIALQIEQDLMIGNFDSSLFHYTPGYLKSNTSAQNKAVRDDSLITHFEHWVINYRNMNCNEHIDYYSTRNMMLRWNDFTISDFVLLLNKENISPKTYNRRLTILKGFFLWIYKKGIIPENPLEDVLPKKTQKKIDYTRKPFKEKEIKLILKAIKENKFCSKYTIYKHSHYYPFLYFMFKTGVRNAEAVGLRVNNIDLKENLIHINEVLARSIKGSNASVRIRKQTKNGKQRVIPMTNDLKEILIPQIINKKEDELVFTSHRNNAIDDAMFQKRIFKKVLKGLNINYRVLYACRHTFSSRCIDSGMNPVTTAFLLGNNPETALRNYTHLINLPKDLPDI